MDRIRQENERQTQVKVTRIKKNQNPIQIYNPGNQTSSSLKNKNQQPNFNYYYPKNIQPISTLPPINQMIPLDSDPLPNNIEKLENGDNTNQKKIINKKGNLRNKRKVMNSISNKTLPITAFSNINKIKGELIPNDTIINEKQKENIIKSNSPKKAITILDSSNNKKSENGYNQKRAITPKKKSQDIKIVPFDTIEKEIILEPKILDSTEQQISFSDMDDLQSIFESFFIASLPREEYSFAEDINNPGVSYCLHNLSQCGHDTCIKLPAYKAGLIFQYPKEEKNAQNFQISELVTSLCFPFGIKVCFGKYTDKKKELILPKKPSDFYFVTTNGFNDQNYVYVYNFYYKIEIETFKKIYKCDPIKNYLNILIKNNDRNLQTKFEECQAMINTQYVFIPHTCCLVSKYPYFKEMRKAIYSILKLGDNEEELIKFLKNIIYEIPDINKYKNFDLQLNFFTPHNMCPIVLKSKYYNRGLYIDIKEMKILYEYFQVVTLLKIFKLMLTSQKLLFVVSDSSEYKNLSLVTLALLNILYPFNWKYTYIPLLSFNMLKFLQSFLPFIMGIDNNMMEYAKNNYIEKQNNITIIYLRKNRKSYIDVENPDENANIEIPSELKDMLSNDLKTIIKNYSPEFAKEENILTKLTMFGNNTNQFANYNKSEIDEKIGKQVREVFLKFFVEIFGDYQDYTSSIDDTAYFNSESFLNNVPKEYHNFYLSIFNSEMFHDFLQRNVVINSTLYKPDKYYNKYCIREKKGYSLNNHLTKKDLLKKKKTFLNYNNYNFKENLNNKQSTKILMEETLNKKRTVNSRTTASSKILTNHKSKLPEINDEFVNDNISPFKVRKINDNNNDSSDISDIEEEISTKSLNSSFNEETLKKLVDKKVSNKFIIPPCFLKMQNKDLSLEDMEEIVLNYYGEDKLIKKKEYENKYILEKLPIIDYEGINNIKDKALKEKKQDELDFINRYALPIEIVRDDFLKPKRHRSYTLAKSLVKDNTLDPKIIQLEDFMKEILSSSGKNASIILYPKGIKEIKENSLKNDENSKSQTERDTKDTNEKEVEKENGGSKDIPAPGGKFNIGKVNNLDYLSMIDFQNLVIRRHFASIIFQNKINAYQSNIISSNSYNILTKMIFNVFLYSGNKTIDDFQICRALTKSLYLYYKKNNKGTKIYLFQAFNKAKPFDIWNDKYFWNYFYEREMDKCPEKDDNNKFNVLIEMASIMNDLHFSANTQVDIIIDYISKKEISDKDLQNTLFKTIVKQFNNRVVVSAYMG